jgi:DNA repair protein RadA/Sms
MKPTAFLLSVWGQQVVSGQSNFFCLATKSKSGKWREHFFKWPLRTSVDEFFENHSTDDYDLYFCPHGFDRPKRRKEYATGSRFLWSDMDEQDPARVKPRPQVAWESSPGRHAALWRLSKFHDDCEEIEKHNKGLTYSTHADRGGWDFTQVLRIPGTRNHKYKGSPRGKMLWFSGDNATPLGDFPEFRETNADPMELLSKIRKKIKGETYRLLTSTRATMGKRSEVIWKLGAELVEQGVSIEEAFVLLKASVWNKFAGRRDEDKQLRREMSKHQGKSERKSIAGGLNGHKVNGHASDDKDEGFVSKVSNERRGLIRMHTVEPEEIKYLWYPYIAMGKLTLIEGDPGLGKSWLTMALASYMSRGKKLITDEFRIKKHRVQLVEGPKRVLLLSAEDGVGDTLRPRLNQLEANVMKIAAVDDPVKFDEEGAEEIEEHIQKFRPHLTVIDPIVAYMGGKIDMHKANETRDIMARMSRMAAAYNTAMVGVRHLTKGSRDKAIYRGLGSIDIMAAARSVIMVGRHPEKPDEERVMVHVKCNLAKLGDSISYELRDRERPFRWRGRVEFSAEEVFKAEATGGVGEEEKAIEFLKTELSEWTDSLDVIREAEGRGIAEKALKSARRQLGVMERKKDGVTEWKLAD